MKEMKMETEQVTNGWGVGLSAILGGALGYWAGRSTGDNCRGPYGGYPPYAVPYAAASTDNGHCRTCYQEGVQSGSTAASLSYLTQKVAANANDMSNIASNLASQMTSQFNAIQNQFNALAQQKIADQAAQIAALRTQNVVGMNAATTNATLAAIQNNLQGITAGCAVRSVPACNNGCSCGA